MPLSTLQPIHDRLREVERALCVEKARRTTIQLEISNLNIEAKRLRDALAAGHRQCLVVSDHALLRYAERVLGFDPTEVVRAIERDVEQPAVLLGDGTFPFLDGRYLAVVKDRTVVTIKPS
jgi:hypothetical protein